MDNNVTEIRIYTGSGYEDFTVGEKVIGAHIFSEATNRIRTKNNLPLVRICDEITIEDDGGICIFFDSCEGFYYKPGTFYRTNA